MRSFDPLVAIVDDDANVRESVEALLRSRGTMSRTFASGGALLGAPDLSIFACILLDVRMDEMDGFDVLRAYRRRGGAAPIIMLTAQRDLDSAVKAIRAGATDFLTKPYDPDELVRRIASALDGKAGSRSGDRTGEVAELMDRVGRLTEREHEVFGLLIEGHSAKSVAAILGISPRTVEVHRARVMEKMEARNLASLVRMGMALPDHVFVRREPPPPRFASTCR